MYNLNINLAETAANAVNNLLIDTNGPTPRTPEILNSLIAMTNPLDYTFGDSRKNGPPTNLSTDSNSSSSTESPINNPPSVQKTCSQLIKVGLKLSIEQKRKQQSDGEDLLDLDKCKRLRKIECSESEDDKIKLEHGLTPEDEERRRRRRERNKIAATKCRLKKRERTANLITESETLETQNIDLKNQFQELQKQKLALEESLALHRPVCQQNIKRRTRDSLYRLPPVASVMETHSYSRPASVDPAYRNQNVQIYNRPASVGASSNNYSRHVGNNGHCTRAPSIIVEEIGDCYQTHLTTIDNSNVFYNQCHNYSGNQNYANTGMDNGCMA